MRLRIHLAAGVPAVLVLVAVSACGGGGKPAVKASLLPVHRHTAAAAVRPSPAKSCSKPEFDYLVRSTEPDTQATVVEIGNLNLATCRDALDTFRATAGTAAGECTTIAKASDNPGYDVNRVPAAPLKGVLMSAGPDC